MSMIDLYRLPGWAGGREGDSIGEREGDSIGDGNGVNGGVNGGSHGDGEGGGGESGGGESGGSHGDGEGGGSESGGGGGESGGAGGGGGGQKSQPFTGPPQFSQSHPSFAGMPPSSHAWSQGWQVLAQRSQLVACVIPSGQICCS